LEGVDLSHVQVVSTDNRAKDKRFLQRLCGHEVEVIEDVFHVVHRRILALSDRRHPDFWKFKSALQNFSKNVLNGRFSSTSEVRDALEEIKRTFSRPVALSSMRTAVRTFLRNIENDPARGLYCCGDIDHEEEEEDQEDRTRPGIASTHRMKQAFRKQEREVVLEGLLAYRSFVNSGFLRGTQTNESVHNICTLHVGRGPLGFDLGEFRFISAGLHWERVHGQMATVEWLSVLHEILAELPRHRCPPDSDGIAEDLEGSTCGSEEVNDSEASGSSRVSIGLGSSDSESDSSRSDGSDAGLADTSTGRIDPHGAHAGVGMVGPRGNGARDAETWTSWQLLRLKKGFQQEYRTLTADEKNQSIYTLHTGSQMHTGIWSRLNVNYFSSRKTPEIIRKKFIQLAAPGKDSEN
jgi:hypothetical protein